jgi:DNA-binding NarL/FixJ family response regulator
MHSVGFVAECQGNLAEATAWYRQGLALAQEIRNNREIGWHLTGLASVAAAEGQFYQAAHILGAAEKRFDIKVNMHVVERTNYEHMVEKIRTQLGEQVFAAAWTAGRNMTPEQALAAPTYPPVSETAAPPELPTTPAGIPAPKSTSKDKASRRSYPAGLTAREAEVLQQLAQGLSDAEIAQRLVISERTVGKHLENIFQKIGVNNRGAAIRYTLDNGLA